MARKPAPSLPDVFAKPGAAPARGTPIEDLPQPTRPVDEPAPKPDPAAAVPPAAEPPQPAPEPAPVVTPPPLPPVDETPADTETGTLVARPSQTGRRTIIIAALALVIGLTAPLWENYVLLRFGILTPIGQVAERNSLAVVRQDKRADDIQQRLAAATAQIAKLQTDMTNVVQRADRVANLTGTLSLVRLSDTLRRPMPFEAELRIANASGADLTGLKPLLAQIEPYADTGIPGAAQLAQEFRSLYDQASRAERGSGPVSWANDLATWAHLRSPPPPPALGDPSLQFLRDASARMADFDIAGTLDRVQQVSPTYRPIFASWIDDARARVAADTLADKISDMVTQVLKPAGAK